MPWCLSLQCLQATASLRSPLSGHLAHHLLPRLLSQSGVSVHRNSIPPCQLQLIVEKCPAPARNDPFGPRARQAAAPIMVAYFFVPISSYPFVGFLFVIVPFFLLRRSLTQSGPVVHKHICVPIPPPPPQTSTPVSASQPVQYTHLHPSSVTGIDLPPVLNGVTRFAKRRSSCHSPRFSSTSLRCASQPARCVAMTMDRPEPSVRTPTKTLDLWYSELLRGRN